jgi:transcriptional regulator with XRE-family HTH domain
MSSGEALKAFRLALGKISQESLAHRVGVTLRTVYRWEKGDSISIEALARLYHAAVEGGDQRSAGFFHSAILSRLDIPFAQDADGAPGPHAIP